LLHFPIFHGEPDGNRNRIDDGFDDFGPYDIAGLEVVGLDDLVDGV